MDRIGWAYNETKRAGIFQMGSRDAPSRRIGWPPSLPTYNAIAVAAQLSPPPLKSNRVCFF